MMSAPGGRRRTSSPARAVDLPNPGLPGEYEVLTLTYGSGKDLHRSEYGDEVDLVARRVNGAKLIDNWDGVSGWLRTSYWGFDVKELPLQARVWYPDGDGPFPLVLVVHGNHGSGIDPGLVRVVDGGRLGLGGTPDEVSDAREGRGVAARRRLRARMRVSRRRHRGAPVAIGERFG